MIKQIQGAVGYWIDTSGNIYTDKKPGALGRTSLRSFNTTCGYQAVNLCVNGKAKQFVIHRLMAAAFLGLDISNKRIQVNHKDCNKQNNNLSNLEIVTPQENTRHYHLTNPGSSKSLGVSYRKNRRTWQAYTIGIKPVKYLGSFKTEQEALLAHQSYAQ